MEFDQGYHAILGTPNGASTMRMLADHRQALGYRIVERVVVLGKEEMTMEKPESRSFLIILAPRRTPPTRIPGRH
jgi:hypothetical protein